MGDAERLAFDDPQSESNAVGVDGQQMPTSSPHTLSHATPCVLGSPMEVAVEVHVKESELDNL